MSDQSPLDLIGITKEDLRQQVIDRITRDFLDSQNDGNEYMESEILGKLQKHAEQQIDKTVEDIAAKHVLPNVAEYIENLTIQKTNDWGEKRGERLTFIEYLVSRAEAYLNEKVNHTGDSKSEGGYQWSGKQTRITYLINKHLHYSIETAMEESLSVVNKAIGSGVAETIKIKIADITKKLKIGVSI